MWCGNSDHVHVLRPILLQVVPVYCFDPRHYGTSPWGVKKTGDYRAKFLLESINDLKQNLQQVYIFAHNFFQGTHAQLVLLASQHDWCRLVHLTRQHVIADWL